MLSQWLRQRQFNRQYRQLQNSSLAELYQPVTEQQLMRPFADSEFLVLDFETTGLHSKTDRVLSAGWTVIANGRIQLGQSEHTFIRHTAGISDESVGIHHITEQEASEGVPVQTVFPRLLKQLSGRILVAHFADIEVGFIQQIAQSLYQLALPLYTVDTLQLAFRYHYQDSVHVPQNALNLFNLRARYQLPRYKAHNAMLDAVATAELLLLLVDKLGGEQQVTVKRLL